MKPLIVGAVILTVLIVIVLLLGTDWLPLLGHGDDST